MPVSSKKSWVRPEQFDCCVVSHRRLRSRSSRQSNLLSSTATHETSFFCTASPSNSYWPCCLDLSSCSFSLHLRWSQDPLFDAYWILTTHWPHTLCLALCLIKQVCLQVDQVHTDHVSYQSSTFILSIWADYKTIMCVLNTNHTDHSLTTHWPHTDH